MLRRGRADDKAVNTSQASGKSSVPQLRASAPAPQHTHHSLGHRPLFERTAPSLCTIKLVTTGGYKLLPQLSQPPHKTTTALTKKYNIYNVFSVYTGYFLHIE